MVGVPGRSNGCNTCRKRKVKCGKKIFIVQTNCEEITHARQMKENPPVFAAKKRSVNVVDMKNRSISASPVQRTQLLNLLLREWNGVVHLQFLLKSLLLRYMRNKKSRNHCLLRHSNHNSLQLISSAITFGDHTDTDGSRKLWRVVSLLQPWTQVQRFVKAILEGHFIKTISKTPVKRPTAAPSRRSFLCFPILGKVEKRVQNSW